MNTKPMSPVPFMLMISVLVAMSLIPSPAVFFVLFPVFVVAAGWTFFDTVAARRRIKAHLSDMDGRYRRGASSRY